MDQRTPHGPKPQQRQTCGILPPRFPTGGPYAEIRHIPLDAIAEDALARDRAALDPDALQELKSSIVTSGLRMPIEVYERPHPEGERIYGLISGFRRLIAFRELHAVAVDKTRFPTIPAFVRTAATIAEAVIAMVEENAIRAEVSPWEQAMVALTARDDGIFDSIDAAFAALYANLNREKRRRLRVIAHLIEDMDGELTAPETWSLRRLLRIAAASNRGFGPVIRHALSESRFKDADAQWRLLLPILTESENPDIPAPRIAADGRTPCTFLTRFLGCTPRVARSEAERNVARPAATARIGVALQDRADSAGATNRPLWPDHLGGTRALPDGP